MGKLRSELKNLLFDVISEYSPGLQPIADRLVNSLPLQKEEKCSLILLMTDEIMRTGFFETEESIKRGLMLEEIADFIGDID